jgi:hypothetical protein
MPSGNPKALLKETDEYMCSMTHKKALADANCALSPLASQCPKFFIVTP